MGQLKSRPIRLFSARLARRPSVVWLSLLAGLSVRRLSQGSLRPCPRGETQGATRILHPRELRRGTASCCR